SVTPILPASLQPGPPVLPWLLESPNLRHGQQLVRMSSGNLLPVLIVPRHDRGMADYDTFAKFYDLVMGARTPGIERVRRYIERYRPSAASLLELGCGTGAVVAGLAEGMRITGIDLSTEMLKVATRNVPEARFVEGDITAFSLGEKFDVVICVFDTINHLMRF